MSIRDIPENKLLGVARYLDGFPSLTAGQKEEDVEQYYCLLSAELRRLPPPLGAKFTYTRSEMTDFGMATVRDESPSIQFLHDLQKRGLPFNAFISCLERIQCQGALNEFISATRPEMVVQPQARCLNEGDTLELECEARCKPGTPTYFWFRKRDDDPSPDWEPLVNSFSNRLVIEDVNTGHTGLYICRATNPQINREASVFSEEIRVEVKKREVQQNTPIRQETERNPDPPAFPPVIVRQLQSVAVEYGRPARLHCQADGNNITYDWFKAGEYFRSSSVTLQVAERAEVKDGGRYYCKMTNPQGGYVVSNTVTLSVVPVIVIDKQPPKSFQGDWSEKIRLECSAHSVRGPVVYQWLKNRRAIHGTSSAVYEGTLRCRSSRTNTFLLQCQVSLRGGSHSMTSAGTRVIVNLVKIVMQPRDAQGFVSGIVSLQCKAKLLGPASTTGTTIQYLWLKSDQRGGKKEPLQAALNAQLSDGMLLFDGLKNHHDGYYVCQACFETTQFVESHEVKLSVSMSGESPEPQLSIVRQPVSWVVAGGGTFKMRCRGVVTPIQPLQYQWFRDNRLIPNETSPQLIRSSVTDVDYATYHCEVKTEDGCVSVTSDSAYTTPGPSGEQTPFSSRQDILAEGERKLFTLSEQRYAREKVALLIGNQKYNSADLDKLTTTENDVRKVAEKLRELRFKVFTFVNLRLTEMDQIIKWFCGLLSAGVYGLFYYSGHGFSSAQTSYLMPVDSPEGALNKEACIATDFIANKMQKTLCRAVLILDCCRVLNREDSLQRDTVYETLNVANVLIIHSTPLGNVAYESSFGPSFIAALDKNDDMRTLHSDVHDEMKEKATINSNNCINDKISMKDPIMRDDIDKEREAERICDITEKIQGIPGPMTLTGPVMGRLADLLSLRLCCTAQFTNVLTVQVELNQKKIDIASSLELDVESLRSQGVETTVVRDTDNYCEVTLRDIQKLKKQLSLSMLLTVCSPGAADLREKITHTFTEPPLSDHIKPSS